MGFFFLYLFAFTSALALCFLTGLRLLYDFFSLLIWQHWSDPFRRSRRQDVKYGNPIRQCRGFNSKGKRTSIFSQ